MRATRHFCVAACVTAAGTFSLSSVSVAFSDALDRHLQQGSENGIAYVCGGIGASEVEHMKRLAPQYELVLTFASSKGNYLADVNVEITTAGGGTSLLRTRCGGPIMMVDFAAPGTYQIQAETAGHAVRKVISVPVKSSSVSITWPAALIESGVDSNRTYSGRSVDNSGR